MWCCIGVMQRKKRHGSQLPGIGCKPDATNSDKGEEVEPVQRYVVSIKGRRDDPVGVDDAHTKNQNGNDCNRPDVPLLESGKKQEERHEEMKRNQSGRHPLPSVMEPAQIPVNLFRKIAG